MCSLENFILKIKRWASRIRQSFYTCSCVLGGSCLVGRTKKGTEPGIGHDQQGQATGVWNAPSEALSFHPESSGSHSGVSAKRIMIK